METIGIHISLKLILLCYLLLLPCTSSSSTNNISELFEEWCKQYNKNYSSEEEKLHRLKVFADNYEFVTQHNSMGNSSYTVSLNAFADLTEHEFKASRLGLSLGLEKNMIRMPADEDDEVSFDREIPAELDWRKIGAVTNVKDQGSCGACWAFSATGAIEAINQIVTGSLVSLSEQELIDCDRSYNSGCEGGLMDYAFQFVINNHGIDTEEDYSFRGRDGSCNRNKLKRRVVTIDGYTDVPPTNEKQLLQAVANQPVSVGLCGSGRAFQLYSGGIFTGPCSTSLDHAVLIVGYGSENGKDYWILKNSWGTSWGEKGYMYMLRNSGDPEGVCGINMLASYPSKTSPNPPPGPPGPPGPTWCNLFTYCAAGETCCCAKSFLGLCLSYKCCGLNSAVCCKDHIHCCPHDYPICDTKRNLCLKSIGNGSSVQVPQKSSRSQSNIIEAVMF